MFLSLRRQERTRDQAQNPKLPSTKTDSETESGEHVLEQLDEKKNAIGESSRKQNN
jgi:hypothetical protein